MIMRAGIYSRVSTPDQRLDSQIDRLRAYVEARGWCVAVEESDKVTGTRDRRPGLDAVMTAARRREIDVVVVAGFDRFARSVRHLLTALDEFGALGVEFVSLREQVDTSTPLGRMVFTIVAAVAELERELIRERVRAGLASARRRGVRLGRPRRFVDVPRARRLMSEGRTLRATARVLGLSPSVLSRALRAKEPFEPSDGPTPIGPDGSVAETPSRGPTAAVRNEAGSEAR